MSKTSDNKDAPAIEESSGNIFADLGLANPEKELVRARLILQIYRIIKARKLTQAKAAGILAVTQPDVSRLMTGRGNFSIERLAEFLNRLDQDVEITVRPKRKDRAETSVVVR